MPCGQKCIECPEARMEVNELTGFRQNRQEDSGILGNAKAYTHTSVANLDPFAASALAKFGFHLSNIQKRNAFRHELYVSKALNGMIYGFGSRSTKNALDAMRGLIHTPS
ncbi:MAG: 3-dehydroquinate dehydratase [Thalassospira sp.]|nr:3-dehydroquinate dehydratase [Thalassospira sp.]